MNTLEGHSGPVTAVTVLDHDRIVSASDDHTLRIWAPGRTASGTPCTPSKGIPPRSTPSPSDHNRIVSASTDHTLRIWAPTTTTNGAPCTPSKAIQSDHYRRRPDHDRIVSGGAEGIRIWNLSTGACTYQLHTTNDVTIATRPDLDVAITPLNPKRRWLTERVNGHLLPADAELFGYTQYVDARGGLSPAYLFPELIEWDDEDDPRTLIMRWPHTKGPDQP
ncbi:MAG: hypothetical protein H6926_03545 [Chromatiales bacterium]|nr:hypothetical protein [Chromatiales bacterium]